MSTYPKLKLSYFDLAGRAEVTRLAFFIGNIPFEDDRFQRDEMANKKAICPYGTVPILEVDGQVLAESSATSRYAARLAGLYPVNNPMAALMVDELMQAVDEFGEQFRGWYSTQDPEIRSREERKLLETIIPQSFAHIDGLLERMQQHVSFQDPTRLSLHDLWIHQFLETFLMGGLVPFVPKTIVDGYTHWLACVAKVDAHPRVQEWKAIQAARPQTPTLTLTWFPFNGREEPLRLALAIGGIAFEDVRLHDRSQFDKSQPSLPVNQSFVLEIDGQVRISQSLAALRYLGTLTGLYPTTDTLLAFKIDELFGALDAVHNALAPALTEPDAELQRLQQETLAKETLPRLLVHIDKRVASWSAPFATGPQLTVADLAIYGLVHFVGNGLMAHVPTDLMAAYPSLHKIHELVAQQPQVTAFYATASQVTKP